jgi:hypothetical protein
MQKKWIADFKNLVFIRNKSPLLYKKIKLFDDQIFDGHQQFSLSEIQSIANQDGLFALFNDDEIITEGQILFESTDYHKLEHPKWSNIYGIVMALQHRKKGVANQMLNFLTFSSNPV